jgi:biopolymer transport protein ExbD
MADIAFLLLIFFLVTTTIAEESGVLVKLPPWSEENDEIVNTPHVLTVIVNADDQLMVEDRSSEPEDLPAVLSAFVLSPERTPKQAVVSLVHDRSSSYDRYLEVYNALLAGYRSMWDDSANRRYGKAYEFLSDEQRRDIRKDLPLVISEAEPNDARLTQ